MVAEAEIMTVEEAARYLKVCRKTVYRLLRSGRLRGYRVGRQWRLRRRDLDRWLEENRAGAPAGGAEILQGFEEVRERIQKAAGREFSADEIVAAIEEGREAKGNGL